MAVTDVVAMVGGVLTEAEWDQLEDPPGGRYEVLDGRLVVSPSPDGAHNRFGEDLADQFRWAISQAGLEFDVTIDVEWRSVDRKVVLQAPRGDVVVGRLDPERDIHLVLPLLVVEVWDGETRRSVRNRKLAYWSAKGVRWYWQVLLGDTPTIEFIDFEASFTPLLTSTGDEDVHVTEPFPITVNAAAVVGWTQRTLEAAAARAEAEAARAEAEAARAEAEAARAEAEAARADALAQRVAELERRFNPPSTAT